MGHGLIQSRGSEQIVHTLLTACSLLQGFNFRLMMKMFYTSAFCCLCCCHLVGKLQFVFNSCVLVLCCSNYLNSTIIN